MSDFWDKVSPAELSGFVSNHIGRPGVYNEQNEGRGYRDENGFAVGSYRNSLGKNSVYVGKELRKGLASGRFGNLDIGLSAGLVTGYPQAPVVPMVQPQLVWHGKDAELALGLVPPVKGMTPPVITTQFRRKF